jgi:hypothetical protein
MGVCLCGTNGEMPCAIKQWLSFEIFMYCVVRRSYVMLLMKLYDCVPVMPFKCILYPSFACCKKFNDLVTRNSFQNNVVHHIILYTLLFITVGT